MSLVTNPLKSISCAGPRYTNIIYSNDGTGRDSYIYGNNGGNTAYTLPSIQNKPSSLMMKRHFSKRTNQAVQGKAPRYVQNGTGRDSYISHNDGGFSSPHSFTKKLGQGSQFQNELRSYQKTQQRHFKNSGSRNASPSLERGLHSTSLRSLIEENPDITEAILD